MDDKSQTMRKYLQNTSIKGIVSNIHKELKHKNKNTNNPIKRRANDLNRHFKNKVDVLNVCLLYDPATPLLGIHPKDKKTYVHKYICTRTSLAVSFTVPPNWKQPHIMGKMDKQILTTNG